MLKKTLQTLFIFVAISAFAQQKDRLGMPGPLKFETSASVVEFNLTKSSMNDKTRVITQEYEPKTKSGERLIVTFQPGVEAIQVWEKKAEEIKANKGGLAFDVEMNNLDDQLHSIKYSIKGDKAAERREILIGTVMADTKAGKGSYIAEYFGGSSESYLSMDRLPEMIQIKPEY